MVAAKPKATRLNGSRISPVLVFLSRFWNEPEGLCSEQLRQEMMISRRTLFRYFQRLRMAGFEVTYDATSRRHYLKHFSRTNVGSDLTADEIAALLLRFDEGYMPLRGSAFELILRSALRRIVKSISKMNANAKVSRAMESLRCGAIRGSAGEPPMDAAAGRRGW